MRGPPNCDLCIGRPPKVQAPSHRVHTRFSRRLPTRKTTETETKAVSPTEYPLCGSVRFSEFLVEGWAALLTKFPLTVSAGLGRIGPLCHSSSVDMLSRFERAIAWPSRGFMVNTSGGAGFKSVSSLESRGRKVPESANQSPPSSVDLSACLQLRARVSQ